MNINEQNIFAATSDREEKTALSEYCACSSLSDVATKIFLLINIHIIHNPPP